MSDETQINVAKKRTRPSPKVVSFPASKEMLDRRPAVLEPGETALLAPPRKPLVPPNGISKSMAKTLGCPSYFVGQYMQPDTSVKNPHYLAHVGIEVHQFKKDYVEHLVTIGASMDVAWKEFYLATEHLSEDARRLIERDDFIIDPTEVYGCEIFFSIDKQFRPLEELYDRQPGLLSDDPTFLCSGQIDLLLLKNDGRKAVIHDWKSGYSTVGVTDEEPAIYAALVFSHLPSVQEIEFVWEFVRVDAVRRTSYTREDLPWIKQMIIEFHQKAVEYVAIWNRGGTLPANPFSGLCAYCQVTCPMRPRWDAGELAIGPCQSLEDFRRLAQLLKVCEDAAGQIRSVMLPYMDANGATQELGNGWEAVAMSYSTYEYPLKDALEVLGLQVVDEDGNTPSHTPAYDVPLASLTVGNLSNYAKTKKSQRRAGGGGGVSREGMRDHLQAIAHRSAATRLKIRKQASQELTEQLEASIAQLQSGTV